MEEKKVLILGIDGLDPRMMKKCMDKGLMPNTVEFLKRGSAEINYEMIGGQPTVTPPMWTTLATGCSVRVHGITGYYRHNAENKGILEVRFNQNEVIKEIEDYRLKIHALPINKEEKKFLKNGYQNWDMEIKLKKDKDYFYINREIDPQLQEYNLNIALYKIKKDKNNKVIGYPNFGNQLNIEFKNK